MSGNITEIIMVLEERTTNISFPSKHESGVHCEHLEHSGFEFHISDFEIQISDYEIHGSIEYMEGQKHMKNT